MSLGKYLQAMRLLIFEWAGIAYEWKARIIAKEFRAFFASNTMMKRW
jgi:hypothetical protein